MSYGNNCVWLSDRPGISDLQLTPCIVVRMVFIFPFHLYFLSCKTVLIFNSLHNRLWKSYSPRFVALGLSSVQESLKMSTHVVELGWREEWLCCETSGAMWGSCLSRGCFSRKWLMSYWCYRGKMKPELRFELTNTIRKSLYRWNLCSITYFYSIEPGLFLYPRSDLT